MRIFVGGMNHETNSFNPQPTCVESFNVRRADVLRDDPGVKPFLARGIDVVLSLWAEAIPSGPVEHRTYQYFKESILTELNACQPVDGVCLFLHGAMVVDGIGGGEIDLARAVRESVGPDVLISASLDLHGNINPELADYVNILTAYRTAPHIDREDTRNRAFSLLIDCLEKGLKPIPAIVKIPVMIAGDPAITDEQPASDFYASLPAIDEKPGIVTSSLMIGYSWSDIPQIGSSTIVVAENAASLGAARAEASRLAGDFWKRRGDFRFTVPTGTVEESIRMALESNESPAVISDSGDNVTSGAAGDVPRFAEALIDARAENSLVAGIIDRDAADSCRRAGVGSSARVSLGGKLDTINGTPLSLEGDVIGLTDSGAVLSCRGVDIIIAEKRTAFTKLVTFDAFGVDPKKYRIVVVKLGYLFPEIKGFAARSIVAFSQGFASQTLDLPYKHIPRPIYPLDTDFTWSPPV